MTTATLPPLVPVCTQQPLDFPVVKAIRSRLDKLFLGDELAWGGWRVSYVAPARGGFNQVRLYRGDRIVGVAVVHGTSAATLKQKLVPLLVGIGWTEDCRIEEGAACKRRATRRKLPK